MACPPCALSPLSCERDGFRLCPLHAVLRGFFIFFFFLLLLQKVGYSWSSVQRYNAAKSAGEHCAMESVAFQSLFLVSHRVAIHSRIVARKHDVLQPMGGSMWQLQGADEHRRWRARRMALLGGARRTRGVNRVCVCWGM